ncbi:MAG: M1 family metallopeptidase [Acidimicrobiia bacterium]|nr:M1 family metallopeptidase [Acidimicrobiia bacterium]
MADNPYRLPRDLLPRRYVLHLEPDLEHARFDGSVDIAVDVVASTDTVVLNAAELEITAARVDAAEASVTYEAEHERIVLALDSAVGEGPAVVHLEFTGTLNDKLCGFYRSTYTDDAGEEHTIAVTQFESTDARRAFPCFDEPDMKATFDVSLVVSDGLTAVSNGAVTSAEQVGGGRTAFHFAETMVMSTYLVAFVVGELERSAPVSVRGVDIAVVHRPGEAERTAFALEVAAHSLAFFEDYFGIAYPAGKLDLVAVPDFAFGAMENLGCVTFREALLLADPTDTSQAELTRAAIVIAHEIAHMWFGDLVTMRWWNGIWLNEAFATHMEVTATDDFRPDWKVWQQFALERAAAFDVDALASTRPVEYEVVSPADADGMFDVLTYEKGGSLLRMLEQFLGPDTFREGIRRYLRQHANANTDTGDLWDAIGSATDADVPAVMDSWIYRRGYPLVSVTAGATPAVVELTQERFHFGTVDGADGAGGSWLVPVIVRAHAAGEVTEHRVLLGPEPQSLDLGGAVEAIVLNAGGHGFYRSHYSPGLGARLRAAVFDVMSAVERFVFVDDSYAAVLAGHSQAREFVDLAAGFAAETDVDVWRVLTGHLEALSRVVDGVALDRLRSLVAALLSPVLDRLGWEAATGEGPRDRALRGLAVRTVADFGRDDVAVARCRDLHTAHLSGVDVDPDVLAAATGVVAATGAADDFDVFVERSTSAASPQEQMRYVAALGRFPDAGLVGRACALCLDGTVRSQNAMILIATALANRDHGPLAWSFVADNWEALNELLPASAVPRMLSGIRTLSEPTVAAGVMAFFDSHEVVSGALQVAQHVERLRVNVALRERESERLAAALR